MRICNSAKGIEHQIASRVCAEVPVTHGMQTAIRCDLSIALTEW